MNILTCALTCVVVPILPVLIYIIYDKGSTKLPMVSCAPTALLPTAMHGGRWPRNSYCHWLEARPWSRPVAYQDSTKEPTASSRPRRSPSANREPYMVSAAHHTRATRAPYACLPLQRCDTPGARGAVLLLLLVLGVHVVLAEAPQHREQNALAAV